MSSGWCVPVADTSASAAPVSVSVAMATYNGEAWVEEQLASILVGLAPQDEVVVVDDGSRDRTVEVVAAINDPRLRLIASGANRGYVRAFEAALRECTGDVVLLADQDDVWIPGRRDLLVAALADHDVVASNLVLLGSRRGLRGPFGREDWRLHRRDQDRHLTNIVGVWAGLRPYYGCAMGVRREVLATALPFPPYLTESHDLWLALLGNLSRSIAHLEEPTLERRLHAGNATPDRPRGAAQVLRSRWHLVRATHDLRRRLART